MRKPIIAGNWKMHKTVRESADYARELVSALAPYTGVERVLCPTFVALTAVVDAVQGSDLKVGAQNVHWEAQGAFTSQIAPGMLKGLVEYVIIGHSECRQYLAETDEGVNKKARALLAHGLKPIIAVGESLTQRQAGDADAFVTAQVRAAFKDIPSAEVPQIVVAYEPIWAIGTGMNADGATAQAMIGGVIRAVLTDLYGRETAEMVRIQYGGSVKPDNMAEFMSQPDIDGALVGGASLKLNDFKALVEAAAREKGG